MVEQSGDPLADAAEEISFAHAEHTESKQLHERKISKRRVLALPPPEVIDHYMAATGKIRHDKEFEQFVALLKRQHGRQGSARQLASERFSSPTEQFLALAHAATTLAAEGGHAALLAEVRETLEKLQDDAGSRIQADLNTIDVAAQYSAGDHATLASFQHAYHEAVLGEQDLCAMLKGALKRFGEPNYPAAVSSLILALGADLNAIEGSSAPPARLQSVLQELYLLEVLATGLERCQTLAVRLHNAHGQSLVAGDFLADLVEASVERWVPGSRFSDLAERHQARTISARIALLSGVKVILKTLPVKVYADADARNNILAAAQEALDLAIALEEA